MHFHLFAGIAEMAASLRSFNNNHIGCAVMMSFPKTENDACCLRGADNRCDFGGSAFNAVRKVRWKASTGENDIGAVFNSTACIVFVMLSAPHDVDTYDTVPSNFACFLQLFGESSLVGLNSIGHEVWFIKTDLGSGNDTYAAFTCDCPGETGKAYADSHTTLDDRDSGG